MPQRLCSLRVISGEIVNHRRWRVTNRYKPRPRQSQDMGVMSEFNSQVTELESPRKEGIALAVVAAVAILMSQMMTAGDTAVMMSQTQDTAEEARD